MYRKGAVVEAGKDSHAEVKLLWPTPLSGHIPPRELGRFRPRLIQHHGIHAYPRRPSQTEHDGLRPLLVFRNARWRRSVSQRSEDETERIGLQDRAENDGEVGWGVQAE